jgi:hypothetical protein
MHGTEYPLTLALTLSAFAAEAFSIALAGKTDRRLGAPDFEHLDSCVRMHIAQF